MQHIEHFGLGQFQKLQIILRQTTKSSPQVQVWTFIV